MSTSTGTFQCSDGSTISSLRLRDGMRDCGDGGDEEKEEQQSIEQVEEQESLLSMIEGDPFDAIIIEEGQEEKDIEEYGDGDKKDEENDLAETMLVVRGSNVLAGIPSASISFSEINILYMERRDSSSNGDSDTGPGTSAVILQSRKHAVQIVLDPTQLKSLVAGLGEPAAVKTESGSGSSGGDNLAVCGQQGEEGRGGALGPVSITLFSVAAAGLSINELIGFMKSDKSLLAYIPYRLEDLWKRYAKAGVDWIGKMIRNRRNGGEVLGQRKNDMEMQDFVTGNNSSSNEEQSEQPPSAPLKWVVTAGAERELLIVKTEPRDNKQ